MILFTKIIKVLITFAIIQQRGRATSNNDVGQNANRPYMNKNKYNVNMLYDEVYKELHNDQRRNEAIQDYERFETELKQRIMDYSNMYSQHLADVLKGTIVADTNLFGETLWTEQKNCPSRRSSLLPEHDDAYVSPMLSGTKRRYNHDNERTSNVMTKDYENTVDIIRKYVPTADNKLYGGAAYRRVLTELEVLTFTFAMDDVTENEIAQMHGLSDSHDAHDFVRTVCKLALHKSERQFNALLIDLEDRMKYVVKRMSEVVNYSIERYDNFNSRMDLMLSSGRKRSVWQKRHEQMLKNLVQSIFEDFVDLKTKETLKKCRDDLKALTIFVSWDIDAGIEMLMGAKAVGHKARHRKDTDSEIEDLLKHNNSPEEPLFRYGIRGGSNSPASNLQDIIRVAYHIPNNSPTIQRVINVLVKELVFVWRNRFIKDVTTKFNSYFLLSFHSEFGTYLSYRLSELLSQRLNRREHEKLHPLIEELIQKEELVNSFS